MALKKIPIQPGFNKQATASQAEGQWIDGDNVRFRYGSPEKIGGWAQVTTSTLVGAARAIWSWTDLTGRRYSSFATNKCLYVYDGNTIYDISPLNYTAEITGVTFDSTTGSSTVTCNYPAHNLISGDLITFNTVILPGGGVTGYVAADFETYTFEVVAVPSINSFRITMATNESGTGMTGQGSSHVLPYYTVGPLVSTLGYGWGSGLWGELTWGTERTTASAVIDAASWSLDNYGENLVATIRNGNTFIWYPNGGAGLITRAVLLPNNPTASVLSIVSDRDRHLLQLGTETVIGNSITQDPMFIRFSDQEDIEVYEPTSTNTAGTFRLDDGTTIVGAIRAKDYILVLTDTAAYTIQYVGTPYTFSIRKVGSNCGLIGPHALCFTNGAVWWMGNTGSFFKFDGTVSIVPSLVQDFVFTTIGEGNLGINFAQGSIVYAGLNSLYSEITWFYPTASSTAINRSVTYNYNENVWTTGTLARTTWEDSNVFKNPHSTEYDASIIPNAPVINGVSSGGSYYFVQETGKDEVFNLTSTNTTSVAIPAYIRSGDFDLDVDGDGQYFLAVRRFIPDFKNLVGSADVTIYLKYYPDEIDIASGETFIGPFTITPSTNKVDTRARARLASIKIESDAIGDNWRYGIFRVDVQPDGLSGGSV
jgi:hypothetical protein